MKENFVQVNTDQGYEQVNTGDKIRSPCGRLKSRFHVWKSISSNDHVIDVIENGYKLPCKTDPERAVVNNNKSSRDNPDFVKSEIDNLLNKGCISEVNFQPHVVNPLTVAFNKKNKLRLVLDCRHINPHLFKFRFKYEDTTVARNLFDRGDFLFCFDLSQAYHHIPIFNSHRTFLGFCWKYNDVAKYFIFNVFAFGISTAG